MQDSQEQTKAWVKRLEQSSGGINLPPFVARRLAAVIELDKVSYVDVDVPSSPGGRCDIRIIVLSREIIMITTCKQVALGRHPESEDETTVVEVRSLRDVTKISLAGLDVGWMANSFGDAQIPAGSVFVHLNDDTGFALPQTWRAEAEPPAALRVLVDALSGRP